MILLRLTVRSLRARWVRFGLTSLAVIAGVSFVTGSFVLSDTLRKTFDTIAGNAAQNIDVVVRAEDPLAGDDPVAALREPLPESLIDDLAAVDGVADARGAISFLPAVTLPDGEAMTTSGAPILGFAWTPPSPGTVGVFTVTEGSGPAESTDLAIDTDAARRYDLQLGDVLRVRGPGADDEFRVSGFVRFGDEGSGAHYLLFTPRTAQRLTGLDGLFQAIELRAAPGVNETELRDRVLAMLPSGYEAITGTQFSQQFSEAFSEVIDIIRTVLLVFAFVALFVAGFIINVVFNTTLGQRIRELSLLRAIGAGNGQITRSVLTESLVIGVLSSLLGTVAGIGFAKLLVAVITSQGGGFPDTPLVLAAPTWIVALVVGVGVTMVVSTVPAWRAGRVSPMAAMRNGAGLVSDGFRRRIAAGVALSVIGAAAFGVALFDAIESTRTRLSVMGLGSFGLFMGATALSPLVAKPIAGLLSWPFVRIYGVTGALARGNAVRNPRRTATTASALMIGVALVSMVGVLGASFKSSFAAQLRTGIAADYFLTPENFSGFSPQLAEDLAALDEVEQVTTFRQGRVLVDGEPKSVQAVQPSGLDRVVNLDLRAGTSELSADGVLVQDDTAADLGLVLGDTVEVRFPIGTETLRITGLFHTNVTGANWILSQEIFAEHFPPDAQLDAFGGLALADGVSPDAATAALAAVTADYPDVKIEDRADFQQSQQDQIDRTAVIVNVLLFFSLFIAMLGIIITMMLAVFERTRELGLLRAVGQQRRQTRTMIRIESAVVSLFGTVLGVALGLFFGVSIALALPESVMSTVSVPVGQVIATFVAAGVAGVLAGVIPAWRGARLEVLEAIAYE